MSGKPANRSPSTPAWRVISGWNADGKGYRVAEEIFLEAGNEAVDPAEAGAVCLGSLAAEDSLAGGAPAGLAQAPLWDPAWK